MASSLILHKRITTTLAKAKALRVYVEPLITKSKNDTTHSRRTVFSYLQNKEVVSILFRDVAAKVANRPGGYTRILKMENRLGDNAEMALIELVDYNEVYKPGEAAVEKRSTRRRGSKSKSGGTKAAKPAEAAPAEETPVVETAAEEAPVAEAVAEDTPVVEAAAEETAEAPAAQEASEEQAAEDSDEKKEDA